MEGSCVMVLEGGSLRSGCWQEVPSENCGGKPGTHLSPGSWWLAGRLWGSLAHGYTTPISTFRFTPCCPSVHVCVTISFFYIFFFLFRVEKHLLNQNQYFLYYLQANTELTLFKNEHNVQKKYAYIIKICQFYLLGAEQKSF